VNHVLDLARGIIVTLLAQSLLCFMNGYNLAGGWYEEGRYKVIVEWERQKKKEKSEEGRHA
jgi:hypothetical protein